MKRTLLAIIAAFLFITTPASAATDAQKCSAFKWKTAGGHAECLLKEDAKAVKTGREPDYSKCERKLTIKYTRADLNWTCDVEGEVSNISNLLGTCAEAVRNTTATTALSLVGVDPGWVCTGPAPSGCTTICGDGIIAGNESCDDGNTIEDDGCDANCGSEGSDLAGHWRLSIPNYGPWTTTFSTDGKNAIMQGVLGGCDSNCFLDVNSTDCASGTSFDTCNFEFSAIGGNSPHCSLPLGRFYSTAADTYFSLGSDTSSIVIPPSYLTRINEDQLVCDAPHIPTCGNGVQETSPTPFWREECDDGNVTEGDGCDSNCTISRCGNGIAFRDPASYSGAFLDPVVFGATASEAINDPYEQCDDGNNIDSDGCDSNCTWTACGNGVVAGAEQCDDGNIEAGDGCSADCRSDETCGNSIVDFSIGEECDDGNLSPHDNCSSTCTVECGDGVTQPNEICDDGGTEGGDGCSADCLSDETCGNGTVDVAAGEQCDGGPNCNPDCTGDENFCSLSGVYVSDGGFESSIQDDNEGSAVLLIGGAGGAPFLFSYDTRVLGANLNFEIGGHWQILSCSPVSLGVCGPGPCTETPEAVLTWSGPLP